MPESCLKALKHRRTYIRGRVTRLCNDIDGTAPDTYTKFQLNQHIKTLNDNSSSLDDINDQILSLLWDEEKSDDANNDINENELNYICTYKDRINSCLITLEDRLHEYQLNNSLNVSGNPAPNIPNVSSASRLKPETAPLPFYGGDRAESLEKFIFTFESITDSHNYSEFEKFLLLQKCMKGRAAIIIGSLEMDKQTYSDAKNLLESAFAAPLVQKYNILERLIDLESPSECDDPLMLVSEMRQIEEGFRRLNIDVNLVLQFFYWRAMPESVKTQLVSITNTSKPDLSQIKQNVFQAIERDESLKQVNQCENSLRKNMSLTKSVKRKQINNFAINVNNESNLCTLCNENHKYFKCEKYRTPKEKVKRLTELKGCIKCGYINHKSSDCKLSNLICKICSGNHFPCLCIGEDGSKSESKPKKRYCETKTNIVWSSYIDEIAEGLSLPTFTGQINGKLVRIMRDSGAQTTLVSQKLVNLNKFKVIKNEVCITINGFNCSKNYVTKLVEIPVLMDSSSNYVMLQALCVPKIDIALDIPDLGTLVRKFKSKGYELADKLLHGNEFKIDNIDIVLGTDFAYCNPISTKVFGKLMDSSILVTPTGIMIEGSVKKLLGDIDHLEDNVSINEFAVNVEKKCYSVSENSSISQNDLDNATNDILNAQYLMCLDDTNDDVDIEVNKNLSKYVLDNASRHDDGRLELPLMWNSKVHNYLGNNFNLSRSILNSNLRKLVKDPVKLKLTDDVFREQEKLGIIERVDDFDKFKLEYPTFSFLPHMSVFKMNRATTKCRVVYLSNMAENNPKYLFSKKYFCLLKYSPI